ncbi:MAG TPA: AAA family ATPase [Candidatus Paceibacterota bacterium]
MHLSRLYIENFRSIEKVDLTFKKGRNVIVGRNNAGKSNILKAIDLVLGVNSPTWKKSDNITENDFFKGDTNREVFIWCELIRDTSETIDFEEVKKSAIFKVLEGFDDFRLALGFLESDKDKIFQFCGDDGEALLEDRSYKKRWIGGKGYCKATFDDEFSDKMFFAFAFRCRMQNGNCEKDLVFLYRENLTKNWLISPNPNLREVLLQSAIIPSFRDPKNQLSVSAWGWYGKLLRRFAKTDDPSLRSAFAEVKKASESVFKNLMEKISDPKMKIAFPGTKISFQFNPESGQDIYKSALIYVDDGFNSQLQDKGSGIQSAVIIGLFDFYVREISHAVGSSLLAIEEPELYLHPHGRRVISDRISSFLDGTKNQVILTTHSPEFLSSIEDQNIIVVKKDGATTIAKEIHFDSPKRKQILIKKQNAEMFFADAVILSEGADKYLFEYVAADFGDNRFILAQSEKRLLGKNWLNEHNVSIINCGGKREIWKYAEVLKELAIPFIVVADFDFFRGGVVEYLKNINAQGNLVERLNLVKSQSSLSDSSPVKKLADINQQYHREIKNLIKLLSDEQGIFIMEAELEDYYKIKPSADKERGVIETISAMITNKKPVTAYLETAEFEKILEKFIWRVLGLKIAPK